MRHIPFLLFIILLLLSCQKEQDVISPEELARQDSLALHVATLPTTDCLPVFYAQRMGLFAQRGLDLRIKPYLSQMDCDTALLNARVELAFTDLPRCLEMQGDSLPLRAILSTGGHASLLAAKKTRIRNPKHLNERMVALERLSAADYWSDQVVKLAGLNETDIYRPQINDIQLRTTMLLEQLVDAAFLPEPYATLVELNGHKRLFTPNDSAPSLTCLAMRRQVLTEARRVRQVELFVEAYQEAVKQLGQTPNQDTLRTIFYQEYQLPAELADTTWKIVPARETRQEDAKTAFNWLRGRERRISQAALDSLVCKRFVKVQ